MGKFAGLVIALIAIAVGLVVLYPDTAQQLFFTAAIKTDVLVLKYWYNVSSENQSLESLAIARMIKGSLVSTADPELANKNLDSFGRLNYVSPDIVIEQTNISRNDGTTLSAYWIIPPGHHNKTILIYLHGGGYVSGSLTSHRALVAGAASHIGAKALFVDYRLAPAHPLPAAIDDSITAYKWLIYEQKVNPGRVVLMGDSAGGGLVLLTLLALQDEDKGTIPSPAAGITLSAWTDLSLDRPSYEKNGESDVIVKEAFLNQWASLATNTRPEDRSARKTHKVSPIFAAADKLAKLPPLYMSVGDYEILHDDTVHFAGKATQAGADVKLVVTPHMQHVFPFFYQYMPEGDKELTRIANWLTKHQKAK